ncbi:YeiH family protein [Crenobacter sp. SG2303]|uniref:YeiH family protein n=1 Tax=Crenobacter oryzisoli TaxID=3056844 RepID=A0ABT7XPM4_9NEIS|nr:YeiH family protein [Crenobacter sp. SG2303]MDN0075680.1 YeiH family protein [Crenobacter sp. SG2303]
MIENAMSLQPEVSLLTGITPATSRPLVWLRTYTPGIALCIAVTLAAFGLQLAEQRVFGRAWLEALVLAILIGTAVRSLWKPALYWHAGINFSAKTLLEIAVVLLGASLSAQTLKAAGAGLLAGIVAVVAVTILTSYGIGRLLGLHHRLAMLVACGNSICGNSAIAAVAPVIRAHGDDVAASIAFTAVLGVIVVLGLPLLVPLLHLSNLQYGVLAGLTVYAVPQVLAATIPVSALSAHLGTLVKLVRVLMLGPVILVLSIVSSRSADLTTSPSAQKKPQLAWHKIVPWFIVGFLVLVGLRSANLVPTVLLQPISSMANVLTIISMAALGLGVDVRMVAKAGPRVTLAVVLSIVALTLISLMLIRALGLA